jgi:hypothetical protein
MFFSIEKLASKMKKFKIYTIKIKNLWLSNEAKILMPGNIVKLSGHPA